MSILIKAKNLKLLNLLILLTNLSIDAKKSLSKKESYTVGIYMAADNDLFPFAGRNIKQMQNVGSNEKLNIVVNFNMHKTNNKKISKRFLIKKDKLIQIGPDFSADSGSVNTLIDFVQWQIDNFPADNQVLILWNHGTGIIEPNLRKAINPSELFNYNPKNKLIELNRNIGFLDFINLKEAGDNIENLITKKRGICFDDTTHNYLTNKDLEYALETISKKFLKGKKLPLLACDACLMSMVEVIAPLKEYAEYFVSSQEVVLGTGYDYTKTLEPILNNFIDVRQLVDHIIRTYKESYGKITHDFTQSAVDLSKIYLVEESLSQIVSLLLTGFEKQEKNSLKEAIKLSKHKNNCTHFDEISYIDLGHFFSNLLNNVDKINLKNPQETNNFRSNLKNLLKDGINSIEKAVIANVSGKNLKNATGMSIYFPERSIHPSYSQSNFAKKTKWINLIKKYISN